MVPENFFLIHEGEEELVAIEIERAVPVPE